MLKDPTLLSLWLMLALVSPVSSASECNTTCQKAVVDDYFHSLSAVYRKNSDTQDIDSLFSNLSPNVSYEHRNYGASFNRPEWQAAFRNNLERGAYKYSENLSIQVDQYIHGKGFVAVSYSYGVLSHEGHWQAEGDQNLLAMFAITNGKISEVKEYW